MLVVGVLLVIAALLTALCDRGCLIRGPGRAVWLTEQGAGCSAGT
jgi:hypothetical protein